MRRLFNAVLIGALGILAACDAGEPPTADWCYTYDLTVSVPESLTIYNGAWVAGVGLVTTDDALQISFTESLYINPLYFTIHVARQEGVAGDINIAGTASVFGLQRPVFEVLPGMVTEYPKTYTRESSDPLEDGNTVSANIQTTAGIAVTQLDVGGTGASPYPVNLCAEPTPTPPQTETPAGTPTPTITPSQSMTPSQTHTAEATIPPYNCTSEFDFSSGALDWYANIASPIAPSFANQINTFGVYGSGGWNGQSKQLFATNNDLMGALSITWEYSGVPMDVSSVEWSYTKTSGTYLGGMFEQIQVDGYTVRNTSSATLVSGSYSATLGSFWQLNTGEKVNYYHAYHRDWSSPYTAAGSFKLTSFKLNGTCIPPTFTPTPTFTGSPTNTPTITNTPNLTASPTFTRTPIVIGGGTGTPSKTPTRTAIAVMTWTPPPTVAPPTYTMTMENTLPVPTYDVTPTPATGTPDASLTPVATAPGGTPEGTPEEWGTPWGTPGGWGDGAGAGDVIPWLETAAAEVNLLPNDLSPYVPDPDTSRLLGHAKWLISCVSIQEVIGATLAPVACHAIAGLTLMFVITSAFFSVRVVRAMMAISLWLFSLIRIVATFFVNVLSTALQVRVNLKVTSIIGAVTTALIVAGAAIALEEIQGIVNNVIQIMRLIISIVVGLFVTVATWLFFVVGAAAAIVQSFFTSPALSVPGFPQCVTNPTQHDICAAWYMLDNTVWSGSIGAAIVLLMIVIVDVGIVLWLVRRVLTIIREAEGTVKGGAA